jgi:hypothetical protein
MSKFTYTTSFSSVIKPVVSEEKDKFLALASLVEIGKFIPNVDTATNTDLLAVAFNACVINRVNKNGDVIDTDTALSVYKQFINKPINIEHNRQKVIGVIVSAGFSEFGTDKPLTEEQVKGKSDPFNITLGGLVWRLVNPDLADLIEDSNDPTSPSYMGISASWELGFMDYKIAVLPDGQKNLASGEIISDGEKIGQLKNKLKSLGGDGKTIDDKCIYRMPSDTVLPLGIGFTQKPAADVEGIATKGVVEAAEAKLLEQKARQETALIDKVCEKVCEKLNNKTENISQSSKADVKIERIKTMKINSITDITDENLKQSNASEVADFITTSLTAKSKEWEAEKGKFEKQIAEATEKQKQLEKENAETKESVKQLQASLQQLQAEKLEQEKVQKFNARMSEIDQAYTLDDEARAALVEEIKALASDEDFDKFKKKASVLLKGFAKKAPPFTKEETCKDCGKEPCACEAKKKAKASEEAKASEVVEKALENADKDKTGLPNSSSSGKVSLKEKYQAAFAMDGFVIKK